MMSATHLEFEVPSRRCEMSWYANTLYPTLETVFGESDQAAPTDPDKAAEVLEEKGHLDVAEYVAKLGHDDYERLLFEAKVAAVNQCHPGYDEEYDHEQAMDLK